MMAAAGAFLGPTLVVTHLHDWMLSQGFDEASIGRSRAAAEEHMASIRLAIAAGVALVNGTDFPPGSRDAGVPLAIREMELHVRAGLEPLDAIRAATLNAARLLRAPALGRIAVGGPADMIVVGGNPLEDITAMRHVHKVIQAGQVVYGDRSPDQTS